MLSIYAVRSCGSPSWSSTVTCSTGSATWTHSSSPTACSTCSRTLDSSLACTATSTSSWGRSACARTSSISSTTGSIRWVWQRCIFHCYELIHYNFNTPSAAVYLSLLINLVSLEGKGSIFICKWWVVKPFCFSAHIICYRFNMDSAVVCLSLL